MCRILLIMFHRDVEAAAPVVVVAPVAAAWTAETALQEVLVFLTNYILFCRFDAKIIFRAILYHSCIKYACTIRIFFFCLIVCILLDVLVYYGTRLLHVFIFVCPRTQLSDEKNVVSRSF